MSMSLERLRGFIDIRELIIEHTFLFVCFNSIHMGVKNWKSNSFPFLIQIISSGL